MTEANVFAGGVHQNGIVGAETVMNMRGTMKTESYARITRKQQIYLKY